MGKWLVSSLNSLTPEERHANKGSLYPDPFALAELYHENSKFHPGLMSAQLPRQVYSKPNYLPREDVPFREIPAVSDLPSLDVPLGDALRQRRSSWEFGESISLTELELLLQHSFGVTGYRNVDVSKGKTITLRFRSYPSGGALYPMQIYLYANRVKELEAGLYVFSPYESRLYCLEQGRHLEEAIATLLPSTDPNRNPLFPQSDYSQAAVYFFLAADFRNQADKYGLRAYRLTMLEAGHAAQNLLLVSTALRMVSVPLAGFYDDRANRMLHLDGVEQALIYLIPVGGAKEGE